MKRFWKYVILTIMMSLVFSVNASAKDYITKENFDYEWYLEKHPDLASVVDVNDKETIWNFYLNIGEPAGWNGRVAEAYLIREADFDDARYASENPDVAAVFGTDSQALYEHYVSYGIAEGRKGYSTDEETNAKIKIYTLAESINQNCHSDREKVKAVHDWLVKNVAYDYDNYKAGTIPYSSYGMQGAILHGKSVCQGYAEAFEYFMDVLGIECELISGTANNGNGTWAGHAWNKVKIDGKWLYIDVTWDDPIPDRGANVYWYKYYLVTDATFGGDHRADN